jgi:hypothetical protein
VKSVVQQAVSQSRINTLHAALAVDGRSRATQAGLHRRLPVAVVAQRRGWRPGTSRIDEQGLSVGPAVTSTRLISGDEVRQ